MMTETERKEEYIAKGWKKGEREGVLFDDGHYYLPLVDDDRWVRVNELLWEHHAGYIPDGVFHVNGDNMDIRPTNLGSADGTLADVMKTKEYCPAQETKAY